MTLSPGQSLGEYEILSPLGAGGMGEVYRARDRKLGREVAIKVLLEGVAGDPDRLARFEREAKTLASLNHQNIATLHGFFSAAPVAGAAGSPASEIHFLVMELVEGETLADRLVRGPLEVRQAVPLFLQIAEGLEAAHGRGVIHRDLKPANIKVTPEGQVKLLDFGLAKAFTDQPHTEDPSLSDSPTMTLGATRRGEILGTAGYMSPEQARGQAVDRRTDIWAFGACLFEALTGRPPFEGDTAIDILSGVLEREPDWTALAPVHGSPLEKLVRRCLRKNPSQRLHDIADARIELADIDETAEVAPVPSMSGSSRHLSRPSLLIAMGLLGGAAIASLVFLASFERGRPTTTQPWTFAPSLDPPPRSVSLYREVALAPDGLKMIYGAGIGSGPDARLWLREPGAEAARALNGSDGCTQPFFSPSGAQAGFFCYGSDGFGAELKRTSFGDEEPIRVADVEGPYGASWRSDGQIVIGQLQGPLLVASAGGSEIEPLTKLESGHLAHSWPEVLPSGQGVLFTVLEENSFEDYYQADIYVYDFATGTMSLVVEGGSQPQYVTPGFVVFGRAGTLLGIRFDEDRLSAEGSAFQVLNGVGMNVRTGSGQFSVARDEGSLAYLRGAEEGFQARSSLVWVDHRGNVEPLSEVPRNAFATPRLSPDGRRMVASITGKGNRDIWVYDLESGAPVRITDHPAVDSNPFWSSDGQAIVFSSFREEKPGLYRKRADGAGDLELVISDEAPLLALAWAADGEGLIYQRGTRLFLLEDPEESRSSKPLTPESLALEHATIASDAGLIAYRSDESGDWRVFVQDFPDLSWRKTVYSGLANEPLWSSDGQQLFFRSGSTLLRVDVSRGPDVELGSPEPLFDWPWVFESGRDYDVSQDGSRFLVVQQGDSAAGEGRLVVVQNWTEQLERLAPSR